jgi:hypothetical protein
MVDYLYRKGKETQASMKKKGMPGKKVGENARHK